MSEDNLVPGENIGERTLARLQALQLLFQAEAVGRDVRDVIAGDYVLSDGPLIEYATELATNVADHVDVIDVILAGKTQATWSLDRLNGVDRNLLRMALAEMFFESEVATPVAINECIELAKSLGTDDSGPFVNGVLGSVARDVDAGIDVVGLAEDILKEPVIVEEVVEVADDSDWHEAAGGTITVVEEVVEENDDEELA